VTVRSAVGGGTTVRRDDGAAAGGGWGQRRQLARSRWRWTPWEEEEEVVIRRGTYRRRRSEDNGSEGGRAGRWRRNPSRNSLPICPTIRTYCVSTISRVPQLANVTNFFETNHTYSSNHTPLTYKNLSSNALPVKASKKINF
jgi:hypothetical protein